MAALASGESPYPVQLVVSDDEGISSFGAPDEAAFLRGALSESGRLAADATLRWRDPAGKGPAMSAKSEMLHGVSAPKICHSGDGRVLP